MKLRTIKEVKKIKGKVVLLRAEFNVPVGKDGKVDKSEDYRLKRTVPTIEYLTKKGAKVVIITHIDRPGGKVVEKLRLDPVAKRLSRLLGKKVKKLDKIFGKKVESEINKMKEGEILMLENVRFNPGEKKNSKKFARKLAGLGDLYVNDAFGVCHREHASVAAIAKYLPSYAGLLIEKEVKELNKFLKNPKRPLTAVIGGAKVSTKIPLIKKFLKKVDFILLGGALANTIFLAKGYRVGKSLVEPEMVKEIKKLKINKEKLILPVDIICCEKEIKPKSKCRVCSLNNVRPYEYIVDIGPKTIEIYKDIVKKSKMLAWNGPMGVYEIDKFAKGTYDLARAVAKSNVYSILGGGETNQVVQELNLEGKISFVSTGGGAMLKFLEKGTLPALKPLLK